jgi:hypothetical protein
MAKTMATILGAGFLLVGIVGFIAPELMGMHLHTAHNIVHLVSGALALWVGLAGSHSAARSFCFFFGLVYGLLGVLGFLLGDPGSDRMFTVIPDQLMLGRMDHIVHIVLGALFLIGALFRPPVVATTSTPPPEERR